MLYHLRSVWVNYEESGNGNYSAYNDLFDKDYDDRNDEDDKNVDLYKGGKKNHSQYTTNAPDGTK